MMDRTQEKVEILSGDRGDKNQAAARIKHLRTLVESVRAAPRSSKMASTTPTKAEVDALIEDVNDLYGALNALRSQLQLSQ